MAADSKVEPQFHLGTAHILFLDVVGYSKLVVNEQREVVQQLTEIVRNTPRFCKSDTNGKLIRIPIGDGFSGGLWPPDQIKMALIERRYSSAIQARENFGIADVCPFAG